MACFQIEIKCLLFVIKLVVVDGIVKGGLKKKKRPWVLFKRQFWKLSDKHSKNVAHAHVWWIFPDSLDTLIFFFFWTSLYLFFILWCFFWKHLRQFWKDSGNYWFFYLFIFLHSPSLPWYNVWIYDHVLNFMTWMPAAWLKPYVCRGRQCNWGVKSILPGV